MDSDATVKLITKTLGIMAADKTIGRSEALRRSMVALIEQGALALQALPQHRARRLWQPHTSNRSGARIGCGSPADEPFRSRAVASKATGERLYVAPGVMAMHGREERARKRPTARSPRPCAWLDRVGAADGSRR